jgi:hypothetical protein
VAKGADVETHTFKGIWSDVVRDREEIVQAAKAKSHTRLK